jgi:hypothetical protein
MRLRNKLILLLIAMISVVSCGKRMSKTYVDDQKKLLFAYQNHDFKKALSYADQFVLQVNKSNPQDTYVALLERGKVALDARNFQVAIKDLSVAEKRFLDIEGTISISEESSSLFLDDTTKEYEAEPLEKIMISPYLALAYWESGDFQGARIERNRTISKINQYIESKAGSDFLENPFARYLSGIMYENEGKFQDAKIEYRKIMKSREFTKPLMEKELERLNGGKPKLSDLVVFVDLGKSPMKYEKSYKGKGIANGKSIVVSITYAVYKERKYQIQKAKVLVDGKEVGSTDLLYNLSETILAQYKKNQPKLIKSLVARAALKTVSQAAGNELSKKKGVVGAVGAAVSIFSKVSSAIERADLRSWVTLPAEIQVLRASELTPGEHEVQVVFMDKNGNEMERSEPVKVTVKEGEINVAHFRAVK